MTAPTIRRYLATNNDLWNRFNSQSRNGTFLTDRNYMDYHSHVFDDMSLLIYQEEKLLALLPANRVDSTICSHKGLTFGGLITNSDMTQSLMIESLGEVNKYYRANGIKRFKYIAPPSIYSKYPSQEDLFALHYLGAHIVERRFFSVVDLRCPIPFQTRRVRGAKKAAANGIEIKEAKSEDEWRDYWEVLSRVLNERFSSKPVHTIDEILLLRSRFPHNIRLFTCSNEKGIGGGVLIYDFVHLVKAQYIAVISDIRDCGGLDLLFTHLMQRKFAERSYFDLGTSMSSDIDYNKGLVAQKEGFGARTIIQDVYELEL